MKRSKYPIVLAAVILSACSGPREKIKPALKTITESVYASGKVKAAGQYSTYPTVSGIVEAILVQAGDTVKKGDVLFLLDNQTAGLSTENARLTLALSQQNNRRHAGRLQELALQVNQSRTRYRLDSSLYVRQQRLWEQQIGSKLELEQRQLAFTTARSAYLGARTALAQAQIQARHELRQAQVNYAISRHRQRDYIIRSSINGRVYDVLREKGELVTPQTPLAIIGQADSFLLELNVDEKDIARVRPGLPVAITMDSYKGRVYEGQVEKVYPIMEEQSRTFKADVRFLAAPPALYPQLSAEANIIVATRQHVVVIPRDYLVEDHYVWIAKDRKKMVKTGLRDYRKVEIRQGLDTSVYIYKPQ